MNVRHLNQEIKGILKLLKICSSIILNYFTKKHPFYYINQHPQTFAAEVLHTDTAILIQGPFDQRTTLKIIKHYVDHYPQTKILVVLWETDRQYEPIIKENGGTGIIVAEPKMFNGNQDRMIYGIYCGLAWIKNHA